MPISVLRLKVDKDQGLCSGILALIKCVLLVQWKCRQELKLFYFVILNCLINLMPLFIKDFSTLFEHILGLSWKTEI